jgi:beta-phosphoglucomutase-like phosphatase (HAD superfamily)
LRLDASAPVRALIFDMDGTMIDSMGHHRQSWHDFARRHGITMDIDELMRRTTGRTGVECMAELFGRPIAADEARALVREKETLYRERFGAEFREVAGFRAFHAHVVAQGWLTGVGTAGDAENIAFAMHHLALTDAPLAVVGGDEGLPGKPEPAIFLEVARRLGVAPAQCIVFEDALLGVEAAQRAGMRAVALTTTLPAQAFAGFDNLLTTVADYRGFDLATLLAPARA